MREHYSMIERERVNTSSLTKLIEKGTTIYLLWKEGTLFSYREREGTPFSYRVREHPVSILFSVKEHQVPSREKEHYICYQWLWREGAPFSYRETEALSFIEKGRVID